MTKSPAAEMDFYFDIRSPYAYLAQAEIEAIARDFTIAVNRLPYAIAVEEAFGNQDARSARETRKVKYLYMDVRRIANERQMIVRGTTKVFNPRLAHAAYLFAGRQGLGDAFYNKLLPLFWDRQCDIEDETAIATLLEYMGANIDNFTFYLGTFADLQLELIARAAEEKGVFGVPTCVFNGELFWGTDRLGLLRRRLYDAGLLRNETSSAA